MEERADRNPRLAIDPRVLQAGAELWSKRDTRASALALVMRGVFGAAAGHRRLRVAAFVFDMLFRLEGRKVGSRTARELLLKHFGVAVGACTHGECLLPGVFPPNVIVGRFCSIAHGVRVFNQNHPLDRISTSGIFYDPRWGHARDHALEPQPLLAIGHDVWIGENALVTPGCSRIGHGAVVGAGAVVTHDVPSFAIVAGNPARVLKYRFDEPLRSRVLESRWWEAEPEVLARGPLGVRERASERLLASLRTCEQESEPTEPAKGTLDRLLEGL